MFGMNIHKAKTACKDRDREQRRQVTPRRETREIQSPDENHRAQELHAPATVFDEEANQDHVLEATEAEEENECQREEVNSPVKPKLQYPPATDKRWKELNEYLQAILDSKRRGTTRQKLERMPEIV